MASLSSQNEYTRQFNCRREGASHTSTWTRHGAWREKRRSFTRHGVVRERWRRQRVDAVSNG
ncbi:hypothetical protein Q8A73_023211 [Channa argus]|nr:hypothetical protein Q8A73_023211 [Channa argus]